MPVPASFSVGVIPSSLEPQTHAHVCTEYRDICIETHTETHTGTETHTPLRAPDIIGHQQSGLFSEIPPPWPHFPPLGNLLKGLKIKQRLPSPWKRPPFSEIIQCTVERQEIKKQTVESHP